MVKPFYINLMIIYIKNGGKGLGKVAGQPSTIHQAHRGTQALKKERAHNGGTTEEKTPNESNPGIQRERI